MRWLISKAPTAYLDVASLVDRLFPPILDT
jgi:hypothetical protein